MSGAATDKPRAQGLDALRALAALSVMLFHFWVYSDPLPPGVAPTTIGQEIWDSTKWGLLLFFVLSGFLLYRPWVRAAMKGGSSPRLGRYLRLRAARIGPAYYLALAGALLIGVLGSTPPMRLPTHDTFPLFLVFGQNFSDHSLRSLDTPMWTLPIEVSFYLALPAVGLWTMRAGAGRRSQALIIAAIAALGIAWAHVAQSVFFHDVILLQMLPFFALGMLVAVLVQGRSLAPRLCRILLGVAVASYVLDLALHVESPMAADVLEDLPIAAGFACLVAVGAAGQWLPWLMRARSLIWLGVISYGIYLWHQPVMCLLGGHGLLPQNAWLELPLVLPLTVLIAWGSWRLLELPLLRRAHGRDAPRAPARQPRRAPAPRPALTRPAAALTPRRP